MTGDAGKTGKTGKTICGPLKVTGFSGDTPGSTGKTKGSRLRR